MKKEKAKVKTIIENDLVSHEFMKESAQKVGVTVAEFYVFAAIIGHDETLKFLVNQKEKQDIEFRRIIKKTDKQK